MLRCISVGGLLPFLLLPALLADEISYGRIQNVKVAAETRLDWTFALTSQSLTEPPESWLEDYDSTEQQYQCFVPQQYNPRNAWPVLLFIAPGQRATGWGQWEKVCRERGVIFASPHQAGNQCPFPRRVRIVADVLDDLRRKYNVDPDRVYLGGFSGGGRVACAMAFALPEYFGGVVPVCAGGQLRDEPWLRQRVIDRLSVAQLTGENDFNRGEVERMHQTTLSGVGVRCRTWVAPRLGHTIPGSDLLDQAFVWMEEQLDQRRRFAQQWPASRIDDAPTRSEWAERLLAEGTKRVAAPAHLYMGLMQLKGVAARWPDTPSAEAALKQLTAFEAREERPWEEADIAEQRRFLIARARGVDAYASGPLPRQYENQKENMVQAAIQLWSQVEADGQDAEGVAAAQQRIPQLRLLLKEDK
ncbi:hypothetical protein [Lignipirellula cremea]|uniref:Alpha/beta hydrolase family protein n=1 Tax=Lignipirellula cremea TaxID=2528010 RepID=A0A518DQ64_9BACT|nr:hypothetical protein [Lignipirellula cremea]QDU93985.1 Alpha/beta hydrolase family protein [Lignipirellula cremea]